MFLILARGYEDTRWGMGEWWKTSLNIVAGMERCAAAGDGRLTWSRLSKKSCLRGLLGSLCVPDVGWKVDLFQTDGREAAAHESMSSMREEWEGTRDPFTNFQFNRKMDKQGGAHVLI